MTKPFVLPKIPTSNYHGQSHSGPHKARAQPAFRDFHPPRRILPTFVTQFNAPREPSISGFLGT
jgi:hypothetical protein